MAHVSLVSKLLFAVALIFNVVRGADVIVTVAGNGKAGFAGDGASATAAQLNFPWAVTSNGNLLIADNKNARIRIVAGGLINTFAGTASGFGGDGGRAVDAKLRAPSGIVFDSMGNLFIADTANHRIRVVSTQNNMDTYSGTGTAKFSGDGGLANVATFSSPKGLAIDSDNNLYIADTGNNRIRRIDLKTGIVSTVAGSSSGFSGDGGPATGAKLNSPADVTVAPDGTIYIADTDNHRIRMIDKNGRITTFSGKGTSGFGGDGGASLDAKFRSPAGVVADAKGNVYVADTGNNRIRRIDPTGIVSTIAGTGVADFSGDGGPAPYAQLDSPTDVFLTADGILFIADRDNDAVRQMTPSNAPAITSPLFVQAALGDSFSYTVTGTGFPYPKFTASPLPDGLKFDGTKITGTPTSAMVNKVTLTASNGAGPDDVQTLTLDFQGTTVVITSALSKNAQVGDSFKYTITTSGTKPVSISVNALPPGLMFDGDNLISGIPSKAGSYAVMMMASNGFGVDNKTLVIDVNGSLSTVDSDADGFPNELEKALGTGINNADSKPAPVTAALALASPKLSIKLNFALDNRDTLTLTGLLPIPENFQVLNQTITIDIGGSMHVMPLNIKGQFKDGRRSFAMRLKAARGFVPAQMSKFTFKVAFSDLQSDLSDEGLFNRFALAEAETIPVYVLFNQSLYSAMLTQLFTARLDKSGRTTQPR